MFIIDSIELKNVGTIEHLVIKSDKVNGISNKGCIIKGHNKSGKTTLIKAISDCLCNLVSGQGLQKTDAIRKIIGTNEYLAKDAKCTVNLINENMSPYTVECIWSLVGDDITITRSLSSITGEVNSIKDIQNILKFSYISPEEIKSLATSSGKSETLTSNERKLLEYFIISLPYTVQFEFKQLLNNEKSVIEERRELKRNLDVSIKNRDSRKLTALEEEQLNELKELTLKFNEIQNTKTKFIEFLSKVKYTIKTITDNLTKINSTLNNKSIYKKEIELLNNEITDLIQKQDSVKYDFENILTNLSSACIIKDVSIFSGIERMLSVLHTTISNIEALPIANSFDISLKKDKIKSVENAIIISENSIKELREVNKSLEDNLKLETPEIISNLLIKESPFTEQVPIITQLEIDKLVINLDDILQTIKSIELIEDKLKIYKSYAATVLNQEKELINLEERLVNIRKQQIELIKINNIDIPGFEIAHNKLTFNGLSINAASDMEGAQFAARFATAMNKTTKVIFINELLKFDSNNRNVFIDEILSEGYQIIANEVVNDEIKIEAL